jgi:pimeloyl-ACP methyl ester carboxylesterase
MTMLDHPNFRTNRVQANGLTFSYIELGSGPLVLALHGFPDTPRTFRYQMQALARVGYRVVAPYMRGYFPTDAPLHGSYERAALTQDTLALIDALSDQPVVLIGHDWGAVAAYGAAIVAPEKIAKLITIAVPYGETWRNSIITNPAQQRRSWYMFFFQMPFAETTVAHNNYAFLEKMWQDWSPGWAYPPEELQAVKDTFQQAGVLTAVLSYYRQLFNPRGDQPGLEAIRARLGEPIAVPTLYMHGARDGCVGVETTEGMEHWFRNGLEKRIIPDGGHFVHQEQPEQVNQLILEFIQPN